MSDILELETRRRIYDVVNNNPGLHLSKIAQIVEMRVSLVEYHLNYLEKNGMISSSKEKGYTRYFVQGKIGRFDKKFLFLLKKGHAKHKDLLREVNVAPSTLSYHLSRLVDHGVVESNYFKGDKSYKIVNKDDLIRFLINYKPFDLFDSFEDVWDDLSV